MRDVAPRAIGLVAERGRMPPVGLHGVEEQLGQGTGAHGRNLTTKVAGEPGTVSPTARRAIASMTTLSGTGNPRSRTLTKANPAGLVVTVSVVAGGWGGGVGGRGCGPPGGGERVGGRAGRAGRGGGAGAPSARRLCVA